MKWAGKELVTYGDIMNAVSGIITTGTKEDAQEFMRHLKAENQHAEENIGYLSGYFNREDMMKIQDWFSCKHPIFGDAIPTPEEAFEAGKRLGAKAT